MFQSKQDRKLIEPVRETPNTAAQAPLIIPLLITFINCVAANRNNCAEY